MRKELLIRGTKQELQNYFENKMTKPDRMVKVNGSFSEIPEIGEIGPISDQLDKIGKGFGMVFYLYQHPIDISSLNGKRLKDIPNEDIPNIELEVVKDNVFIEEEK
jgi:hypothetical protein